MKIEDLGDWLSLYYLNRMVAISAPMYALILYEMILILESSDDDDTETPTAIPPQLKGYQDRVIDGIVPFMQCGEFAAEQIIGEIDNVMHAILSNDFSRAVQDDTLDHLCEMVEMVIDIKDKDEGGFVWKIPQLEDR